MREILATWEKVHHRAIFTSSSISTAAGWAAVPLARFGFTLVCAFSATTSFVLAQFPDPSQVNSAYAVNAPSSSVLPVSKFLAPPSPGSTALVTNSGLIDPNLLPLVQNSMGQLDEGRIPKPDSARKGLENALNGLENFLATSPSQGPIWKSFLKLDSIRDELNKPSPNLDALTDLEKGFRQNYFGLEQSHFTSVRDALSKFVQVQRFGADPKKSVEILRNRLNRLNEQLQSPDVSSDRNLLHELAQTLSYLQHGNQAPEVISAFRNRFSSPNVRVLASSNFLHRQLARPVNEANPVNELILGTTIRGNSVLNGLITPQLIDNPNQATIRLNLNADFASNNRGYNRSVVINTQGAAQIAACESIALTESGLVALGDTGVDANLQTMINSIEHQLRIVRKIAAKQAAKQKSQANAIGEARLESRVRTQFHEQLSSQLSKANSQLGSAGEPVISRLGIPRPHRQSWSNPNHLAVQWNVRAGTQLAADGACPLPYDSNGITVQIHQSLVGNLLDPILAGRVLRSEEMDRYIAQFGDAAKGIQRKEEDGPWAITMNGFQPVEVQFDDSLVRIRVRTLKMEGPDQELDQPALVEASYRVNFVDNAIQLSREGDINVEFAGRAQRGSRAAALRSLLRKKFEQLFRPELLDQPLRWTDRLPEQLRDLRLASFAIDDGWLQFTLQ